MTRTSFGASQKPKFLINFFIFWNKMMESLEGKVKSKMPLMF